MKKFLLLIIMSFVLLNLYAERIVISIPYESKEHLLELIQQGHDIAYVNPGKEIHIVINEIEKSSFAKWYPDIRTVFTETDMKNNLRSTDGRITGYQSYDQMVTKLFALEVTYPDLCQVFELGPSQGKLYFDAGNTNYAEYAHTIYGIKLSRNVKVHEDEPNYYFFGNIHAREVLTSEICMHIIEYLIETYSESNQDHPLNQSQIWIVPVKNPDGKHVVFTEKNIWYRKTIHDNNNDGKFQFISNKEEEYYLGIDGIDGNRNFSFMWEPNELGEIGMRFEGYPGEFPFQAIEMAYIRDLVAKVPFIAGISYHSSGEQVLYPYGYEENAMSHNFQTISSLAVELANLIPSINGNYQTYSAMASWELYTSKGTSVDYFHHYYNILAYTIETSILMIPPASNVPQLISDQIPAVMHLLNRHKNKFLTGLVTDYEIGEPLKAEIKVFPTDAGNPNRMPIYSSQDFGRYHYALMPGNYQLYVTKDGYNPFLTDFTINAAGQTIVNVEMIKDSNAKCDIVFNNNHINVSVYPNPFNPITTFSFEIKNDSEVKIDIFNIKGQKVNTITDKTMKKGHHKITWNGISGSGSELSSGLYFYKITVNSRIITGKLLLIK